VNVYEGVMQTLIDELGRLPGVGPKSAQRIAFYLLKVDALDAKRLARAIEDAKDRVTWCRRCFNISEGELCAFCLDQRRDDHVVCVVEEPRDIVAVERTGEYRGRYHVLGGTLSALDGVGPEELNIAGLVRRVAQGGIREVIVATNATVDGQTTAHYITDLLHGANVQVTRLAHGVPVGGELDYLDEGTLAAAIRQRTPF